MNLLVELTVSDGCNKRCSYCFERGRGRSCPGADSFDLWKPLLEKLCLDFEAGGYPGKDGLMLSFWGGEPFLRPDRMLEIIDMTAGYGFVSYHVYTNATLRDQTRAFVADPRFKAVAGRFQVQVSYDGSPLNEKARGYGFDEIREQALLLAGAGASVSFKATVRYEDVGLMPAAWDSYAELASDWPGAVRYSPTFDSQGDPREAFVEWPTVLVSLCRREYSYRRGKGRFLMTWFDDEKPAACRLSSRAFLHSDGLQYVCHGCPYSPDPRTVTGSASDGKIVFAEGRGSNRTSCAGCTATHCVCCSAACMPEGPLDEAWGAGRAPGDPACALYREFGWYSRMLRYAILKGN